MHMSAADGALEVVVRIHHAGLHLAGIAGIYGAVLPVAPGAVISPIGGSADLCPAGHAGGLRRGGLPGAIAILRLGLDIIAALGHARRQRGHPIRPGGGRFRRGCGRGCGVRLRRRRGIRGRCGCGRRGRHGLLALADGQHDHLHWAAGRSPSRQPSRCIPR